MPPGTPYNGFLHDFYPIRVDEFSDLPTSNLAEIYPMPIYLLTHTHSDHLQGLQAKSFAQQIICSADAKTMLLRNETYRERSLLANKIRTERTRPYAHLKVKPVKGTDGANIRNGTRDLLKVLPLNEPTEIFISANESVSITLIDANHCPGSVMYLIEGERGNILHTGDFRAEVSFLDSVKRNIFLKPYVSGYPGGRVLDGIFLDTACAMQTAHVPSKKSATAGLISLISLYPQETYFFINAWTPGYEDLLKEISKAFDCQIHLDRYKYALYSSLSDCNLRALATQGIATRFHACERFDRCKEVNTVHFEDSRPLSMLGKNIHNFTSETGRQVVYINPVNNMSIIRWKEYLKTTKRELSEGKHIPTLLVPLARHSPLPELTEFVSLFKPRSVIPNTLIPGFELDWFALETLFTPYLTQPPILRHPYSLNPGAKNVLLRDLTMAIPQADYKGDIELENMIGNNAVSLAKKWTSVEMDVKMNRRLELIIQWILGTDALSRFKAETNGRKKYQAVLERDENDSTCEDEDNWRTAHLLFSEADADETNLNAWERSSVSFDLNSQENIESHERTPQDISVPITPICSPSRLKTRMSAFDRSPFASSSQPHPISFTQNKPNIQLDKERMPKRHGSEASTHLRLSRQRSQRDKRFRHQTLSSSTKTADNNHIWSPVITLASNPRLKEVQNIVSLHVTPTTRRPSASAMKMSKSILDMAHSLATSRPDLIDPTYNERRDYLSKIYVRNKVKEEYRRGLEQRKAKQLEEFNMMVSSTDILDEEVDIDWDRSRMLATEIRLAGVAKGALIFPRLKCVQSQDVD